MAILWLLTFAVGCDGGMDYSGPPVALTHSSNSRSGHIEKFVITNTSDQHLHSITLRLNAWKANGDPAGTRNKVLVGITLKPHDSLEVPIDKLRSFGGSMDVASDTIGVGAKGYNLPTFFEVDMKKLKESLDAMAN